MAEWWHRFLAAVGVGKAESDVSYDPANQDSRPGGEPGPGGSDLADSAHQKPRNWSLDGGHLDDDDTREDPGVLPLHRLQPGRVQPEQLQDGRRDLGRLHRVAGLVRPDGARRVHDERYVPVAGVVAAVLGDLGAGRVDGADL